MLVGKNIRLRPIVIADAPLIAKWDSDPDFGGYFIETYPTTPEQVEATIRESRQQHDRHAYLITDRGNGEPMGLCAHYEASHLPWMRGEEIGYTIHPDLRGRGVATQTACILINHIFDSTPTERVQATVTVGNDASCRVLERTGMVREGIARRNIYLHGTYHDLYLYSIIREDWGDEERYRVGRTEF